MIVEREASPERRRLELKVFGLLAILLAPALAIAAVGGYGLSIWMYQIVAGPPSVATTAPPATIIPAQPK